MEAVIGSQARRLRALLVAAVLLASFGLLLPAEAHAAGSHHRHVPRVAAIAVDNTPGIHRLDHPDAVAAAPVLAAEAGRPVTAPVRCTPSRHVTSHPNQPRGPPSSVE